MEESSSAANPSQEIIAKSISKLIKKASKHTPFRSLCFEQAITCKFMLNRRGIGSTIYFGVANNNGEKLNAHAWTRSGRTILTGDRGRHLFRVVATFGS